MSSKISSKKSSLLAKYSLQYQKKPKSRVFAPLAETYRKLGMHDEALKILREGIKHHPQYTLGYIVLSHVYFDQNNFELAYNTLRPFVAENLENITLQKLFAEICINLGFLEEALQTFKYLLLINPKDEQVANQVKLLEDDLLIKDEEELTSGYVEKRSSTFDSEEDDWVQVDFVKNRRKNDLEEVDEWSVEKPVSLLEKFKEDIVKNQFEVKASDLEDEYYFEEYDNDEDAEIEDEIPQTDNAPIITHTLVDLYCKQGHYDKALEILESIIALHPTDKATLNKIEEIKTYSLKDKASTKSSEKAFIKSLDLEQIPNNNEFENEDLNSILVEDVDNGHEKLMQLVDSKKQKDKELLMKLRVKLEKFAEKIRLEATRKQLNI